VLSILYAALMLGAALWGSIYILGAATIQETCRRAPYYDAFGVFKTIFRELEWKSSIFSWRRVLKTPNAS
jgi:hypothetical protein